MNERQVRNCLERLGQSLSAGDVRKTASNWAFPAVFLADDGATVLTDFSHCESLSAKAVESYRGQGLVSTQPELQRVDRLSQKLATVDVRWPAFDVHGHEKSSESSFYILQLGDDGLFRIRVALTRTI